MRILHIVRSLNVGGIERLVADLALEQKRTGAVVGVMTVKEIGVVGDQLQANGIHVLCCRISPTNLGLLRWARQLNKYLRKNRPDVIIEHSNLHGIVALALRSIRGIVLVSVIHNVYASCRMGFLKQLLLRRIYLRYWPVLATVSESVRQHEHSRYGTPLKRMKVIPNGIVTSEFEQTTKTDAASAAIERRFIVGSVGRLCEQKDFSLMLEAWCRFRKVFHNESSELQIAGDGFLRRDLEERISSLGLNSSVRLLGQRADVAAVLRGFSVFLTTSKYEGHPIAVLEAMAAGLPVVGFDVAGIRDVLKDHVNGLLVAERNPQGIVEALVALAGDPGLRKRLGHAGREIASERYSIQACRLAYDQISAEQKQGLQTTQ